MVAGFRRTISFPAPRSSSASPAAAGPNGKSAEGYRVRSASLPCRFHPLVLQLDEDVSALRDLAAGLASAPTARAIGAGAEQLGRVLASLSDLLHHPLAQDPLHRLARSPLAERLLDDFLRLADAHGSFRAALVALAALQAQVFPCRKRSHTNPTAASADPSQPPLAAPAMSRRPARNESDSSLVMRGRVSPSTIPVYAPPPPDYAGSDSAASHVWWDGAAASSPNLSSPADWVNDVHPAGGYVNFLQTPSFPFPHQIPSHPDMPQNYNFVASSSQQTPLPATQPSATKKTQKGASNKRTHSRSINLEDGDDEEPSNKKRMTWTTKEDERLMGAWLSNSNDAISGNYKKNDQYWDAVTAEYNSNTSDNTRKRQMKQCMSRWHRVNKIVNDFHAVYTELSQVYSSGQSESDLMDKVQIKYEKDHGPFLHKDTWEACKKFPKWIAYNAQNHGSKKRDVADLGDVGVKSFPDDIPRPPMGVKKAKAERDGKGKNKQVSKDMEELNKYIEAQEEASKNRTAVLEVQKRISHDKVEASRLVLEAAKENKEAKTKSKMLEQYTKLLTHDTSGMPDDMKAEHLKAISLMRETLWGKNHQS